MHFGAEHRKTADTYHINVVIAGHISSDNVGINLLLDEIQKKNKIKFIPMSGFRRFERKKK